MLLTSLQFLEGGDVSSSGASSEGASLLDGGVHFQAVLQQAQQQLDGSEATAPAPSDPSGKTYPSLAEVIAEFLAESDIQISPETGSDTREGENRLQVKNPILPESRPPPETGKPSGSFGENPVDAPEVSPPQIGVVDLPSGQMGHPVAMPQLRPVQEHSNPAPESERPAAEWPSGPNPPPLQEADGPLPGGHRTLPPEHRPASEPEASANRSEQPDWPNLPPRNTPDIRAVEPNFSATPEVSVPSMPPPRPGVQPGEEHPPEDGQESPPASETQAPQASLDPQPGVVSSDGQNPAARPASRPDYLAEPIPESKPPEQDTSSPVLPVQASPVQQIFQTPEISRSEDSGQNEQPAFTTNDQAEGENRPVQIPRPVQERPGQPQTVPSPDPDQNRPNTPVWTSPQSQNQPVSSSPVQQPAGPTPPAQVVSERQTWTEGEGGDLPVQTPAPVVSRTPVQEGPETAPQPLDRSAPVLENPVETPPTLTLVQPIQTPPTGFEPQVQTALPEENPEIAPPDDATPVIQDPPESTPVSTQHQTVVDPQPVNPSPSVIQSEHAVQTSEHVPVLDRRPTNASPTTPSIQPVSAPPPDDSQPVISAPPPDDSQPAIRASTTQPVSAPPPVEPQPVISAPTVTQSENGPPIAHQAEVQPPVAGRTQADVPQGLQATLNRSEAQVVQSETAPSPEFEPVPKGVNIAQNTTLETPPSAEPVVQVDIPGTPPGQTEGEQPVRIDVVSRPTTQPEGVDPGRVDTPSSVEDLEETYRVTDQIVRNARLLSRNGTSSVTLRLDPPELGEVTVRLSTTNQVVSGEIEVENRTVQDIVSRNLGSLREALAREGVQIDQIEVSVDSRGGADTSRGFSRSAPEDRSDNSPSEDPPNRDRPSRPWEDPAQQQARPEQDGGVNFLA